MNDGELKKRLLSNRYNQIVALGLDPTHIDGFNGLIQFIVDEAKKEFPQAKEAIELQEKLEREGKHLYLDEIQRELQVKWFKKWFGGDNP